MICSCDICGRGMLRFQGFAFNTTQVVSSVGYWRIALEGIRDKEPDVLANRGERLDVCIQTFSRHATPWIVCERCAPSIDADQSIARDIAIKGQKPKGCGPARNEEAVALAAAYGYSLIFDEWPASLRIDGRPIIYDPKAGIMCDFCRRIVYGEEKFTLLPQSQYDQLLAGGARFVRDPAPGHEIDGKKYRMACMVCMARATNNRQDQSTSRPWWKFWK